MKKTNNITKNTQEKKQRVEVRKGSALEQYLKIINKLSSDKDKKILDLMINNYGRYTFKKGLGWGFFLGSILTSLFYIVVQYIWG